MNTYHSQVGTDGAEHDLVDPYFLLAVAAVVASDDHVCEGAGLQAVSDVLQHVIVEVFGVHAQKLHIRVAVVAV